jgi:Cu(I)-responsive transcriptional regulator
MEGGALVVIALETYWELQLLTKRGVIWAGACKDERQILQAEPNRNGELARRTDTKIETIRYYERIGLLPSPTRTSGNYRSYARPHLERLSFIRRGRNLGFSLDEIRELLRLSDDRSQPCAEVDRIARLHLAEVERKLADLAALRTELEQLISRCQHGTVAECQIIGALAPVL